MPSGYPAYDPYEEEEERRRREEIEFQQYRESIGPLPTLYDPQAGQWREVTPAFAEQRGIPVGPPTQYDVSPSVEAGEGGATSIPSPTEGPSSYWDVPLASTNKPQLFASNEPGVPAGYTTESSTNPFESDEEAPAPEELGGGGIQVAPAPAPEQLGAPSAPRGPTAILPLTYYSIGRSAGGADETEDYWTNRGYSSSGPNLTEGIAAVNPRAIPLGSILRDTSSGEVFIAADRHGNSNQGVVDIFVESDLYDQAKQQSGTRREFELIDQIPASQIPKTPQGVQDLLAQYQNTGSTWYMPAPWQPAGATLAAKAEQADAEAAAQLPTDEDYIDVPGLPGRKEAEAKKKETAGKKSFFATREEEERTGGKGPNYPEYTAGPEPPGMVEEGNIDLHSRPVVKNPDGSISTVRSITIDEDGKSVLIPTVVGDKVVTNQEAIDHYKKTGEHLGKFKNEAAADTYAQQLHEQQADEYGKPAQRQQQNPFLEPEDTAQASQQEVPAQPAPAPPANPFLEPEEPTPAPQAAPSVTPYGPLPRMGAQPPPPGMPPPSATPWRYGTGTTPIPDQAQEQAPAAAAPAEPGGLSEFYARLERGGRLGREDVAAGFREQIAGTFRGSRNPYMEKTVAEAKADIPKLQGEIDAAQRHQAEIENKETVTEEEARSLRRESAEISKKIVQLEQAKLASKGIVNESFLGSLSRAAEESAQDAREEGKRIAEQYAKRISPAHDKQFWMQVADSTGASIPTMGAAMLNPVFGLALMYSQTYEGAHAEALKKGLSPEKAHEYAVAQANFQTPFEVVGDVAFAGIARRTLGRLIKEGTPESVGKWIKERAVEIGKATAGETLVTTPAQQNIEQFLGEQAGIRERMNLGERAKMTLEASATALGQSLLMGGAPVTVEAAGKTLTGGFAPEKADLSKAEVRQPPELTPEERAAFAEREPAPGIRMKKRVGEKESEHVLGVERGKRVTDEGYITTEETKQIEEKIDKLLKKQKGMPQKGTPAYEEIKRKYIEQAVADVKATRGQFPQSDGWAPLALKDVELYKPPKSKEKKARAVWVEKPYQFNKLYPEQRGGVERGTKEYDDLRTGLANKLVGMVGDLVARSQREARTPEQQAAREIALKILAQRGWYRNMTALLRRQWGGFSDMFADLLGALSPNTGVNTNWRFAIKALYGIMNGRYDRELAAFDAHLKAGGTADEFKDQHGDLLITQPESQALFGMNSDKAMKAMLDLWRLVQKGDAPKARNFAKNLIGLSVKATIDRWAGRTLQRLAHDLAQEQGRPSSHLKRLPTKGEGNVGGKHVSPEEVGGAFGLGQDAFDEAAAKLRAAYPELFKGMTAADLQALVWFAEKERWTEHDWTTLDGEGGSFEANAAVEQVGRLIGGFAQEREPSPEEPAGFKPTSAQQKQVATGLWNYLRQLPGVIAARVKDSIGRFEANDERSFDIEVLADPEANPRQFLDELVRLAGLHGQKSVFASRVLEPNEDNPNARPGIEVYFANTVPRAQVEKIMALFRANDVDGFTLVVDPRTPEPTPNEAGQKMFRGFRYQFVPEYAGLKTWGPAELNAQLEKLTALQEQIRNMEGVASAGIQHYDTVVLKRDKQQKDYDSGGNIISDGGNRRAEEWTRRAQHAGSQRTTASGEASAAHRLPAIYAREPRAGARRGKLRGPPKPPSKLPAGVRASLPIAPPAPVEVHVFDRSEGDFTIREMPPTKELLRELKVEEAIYSKLIECLS